VGSAPSDVDKRRLRADLRRPRSRDPPEAAPVRTIGLFVLLGATLWWLLPLVSCNCPECSGVRARP